MRWSSGGRSRGARARAQVARWLPRTLRMLAVLGPIAVIVGMTLLDYHWWSDFLAGLCIGVDPAAADPRPVVGNARDSTRPALAGSSAGVGSPPRYDPAAVTRSRYTIAS